MIHRGILLFVFFITRIYTSHSINSQSCQLLEDAVQNVCGETNNGINQQGRPGKRGMKGEAGQVGLQGPAAIVNYDRIDEEIRRKVEEAVREMTETNVDKKIKEDLIPREGDCDVRYTGKCFRAILHTGADVSFAEGKLLCEQVGWKLANIYDVTHYELIERYMRSKISSTTVVTAWLGMTFNVASNQISFSTGEIVNLPKVIWFPSYPKSGQSYTNMAVYFLTNANQDQQGMHNYPPTANRHGALCEI